MIRYPSNRAVTRSVLLPVLLSEPGEEGVVRGELIVGIVLRDRWVGGTPGNRWGEIRHPGRLIAGYLDLSLPLQPQEPGPGRQEHNCEQRPLQGVAEVLP